MTRRTESESAHGPAERIRGAIRSLWEFAHGFHQGYSQVGKMGPRHDGGDEPERAEGQIGRETESDPVADGKTTDETR